jgi:predicted secreted hydrolase
MLNGFIEGSGKQTSVRGLAWMDHEFMSNALQADQEGWDWFGLMFADGGNLMLYVLRKKGGGISFASGTLQRKNEQRALSLSDFSIETLDFWKSEKSGASYPSRWRIRVPSAGIDETLSPLFADQEISSPGEEGFTYWEGAVESATRSVIGYAEMTGYAGSLNQKL